MVRAPGAIRIISDKIRIPEYSFKAQVYPSTFLLRQQPALTACCSVLLLFAHGGVVLKRLLDVIANLLVIPGLGQELVDGALVDGLGHGFEIGVTRQNNAHR